MIGDTSSRTKVLIASDEAEMGSVLVRLLAASAGSSFHIHTALGDQAVDAALSSSDCDVCLLATDFGEDRTVDLISRMLSFRHDVAIVSISHDGDNALEDAAMQAGAVDFLVKSEITSHGLVRAIRQARDRKHFEQTALHLAAIVDGSDFAILGKTLDGTITSWNAAAELLYGYSADEIIGSSVSRLVPSNAPDEIAGLLARIAQGERISTYETVRVCKDGRRIDVSLTISPIRTDRGVIIGASTTAHDISLRKKSEAQLERQIARIQALRNIDMAITASLDLRVTLGVLLDQATMHLHVDAAAVLLTNSYTNGLEYAAGRGFRNNSLQRTALRMGESQAGKAAMERQIVYVPDLAATTKEAGVFPHDSEGFTVYWAAPLITKGKVEGVLELYHRTPFESDADWLSFLEALAGQAAIAIENAGLFNDLQRSNIELQLAYDSTLEGWSKALDLRDNEIEGHTLRVTDGAVALARAMDVPDEDLLQIRRGALLHDIGKMAIPDSILYKPGPLSAEEWVIMKRHPDYAYQLLSPIPYLRGALDIPYCHHEKWDGSGYPRGLKQDQIPLGVRIFSVVDVFDALTSKRPYRDAVPVDAVREHIASGSGSHFDPKVVDVFLQHPDLVSPL